MPEGRRACCNGTVNQTADLPRRDVDLDVRGPLLMAVVGLLLLQIDLVDIWGDSLPGPDNRWWHAVPLLALCALMAWRRRRPMTCLALGLVVFVAEAAFGGSVGSLLVTIELVYAAGLHGRRPVVDYLEWVVAGAVLLSGGVTLAATRDLRLAVLTALTVFAVFGTSYWWGASSRKQLDLVEAERRRAADEARLAELREADARRSEREQMARDLHDALSGSLSAIAIHAEAGLQSEAARDEALRVVRATSRQAMGELQTMLTVLRPDPAATSSPLLRGPQDLAGVVEQARARGLEIRLEVSPDPLPPLPAAVGQAAHRVLQESLHNVGRHSPSRSAVVGIRAHGDLELEVVSVGAAPASSAVSAGSAGPGSAGSGSAGSGSSGLGLHTMRERVTALGGSLDAGPSPSPGAGRGDGPGGCADSVSGGGPEQGGDPEVWRVRAVIPLPSAGEAP